MQQRCKCQPAGYKVLASEFVLFLFFFFLVIVYRVRKEDFKKEERERENSIINWRSTVWANTISPGIGSGIKAVAVTDRQEFKDRHRLT